jgi:hypothetical protein
MEPTVNLLVITGDHCPSFKNTKRSGINLATGKLNNYTPAKIKARMQLLERGILSALNSWSATAGDGTDLECQKQLRIVLSGLSDDSLVEIPEFSFGWRKVEAGKEGVEILIRKI